MDFWDRIGLMLAEAKDSLTFIAIGGVGGIVFNALTSSEFDFKTLLKSVVVSAFAGYLAGIGTIFLGFPEGASLFCAGIFGFAGGFGLLVMVSRVIKAAGLDGSNLVDDIRRLQCLQLNRADILKRLVSRKAATDDQIMDILDGNVQVMAQLLVDKKINTLEFKCLRDWAENSVLPEDRESRDIEEENV